jgi:hypothetical protein
VIVGTGQIAAQSWHGYATQSTICTRRILINGTTVRRVILCGGLL